MRTSMLSAVGLAVLLPIAAQAAETKNVKVVNTPANPVPVNVQNTPAVTVTNTPSVTVANTPAVTVANTPAVTVANTPTVQLAPNAQVTVANASPLPVVDAAAANAFQVNLHLGFASQVIAIPAGKRLVVDYVAVSGAAASTSGPVQPLVILDSGLNGGGTASYYLRIDQSPLETEQFYRDMRTVIYADTLSVSTAFSGYAPTVFTFNIAISGHLVPMP